MLQLAHRVQGVSSATRQRGRQKMNEARDKLFIYLLGDFSVWLGSTRIPEEAFERRKTRQLLKLLALQADFRLHRDQVLDVLWSELPLESASGQLHKAVHHIRRAFATAKPTTSPEKLLEVKEGELKLWSPAGVTTDVNLFTTLSKQALSSQNLSELERAAAEYRGDLLPGDLYEDWTTESREALKESATRLFKALGEAYRKQGEISKAQESFQLALSKDALQDDIHRSLLSLYAQQGNKEGLTQTFERYRRILRTELDESPSPEMTSYYKKLLGSMEERVQLPSPSGVEDKLSNLPPLTTPLVGRESELALLTDNLAHPNCRLLSVVGTGGVGKTHLVLEAAHRTKLRDGVFFVPLVNINLPNLMLTAIADAVGLPLSGRKSSKEQVFDYLRDREVLLVLDNFEHLLAHSEMLLELCRHAPRLKLLVTTRERLQLKEEWVVSLEGLAYPHAQETKHLEMFPAVSLFLECARRVAPLGQVESQVASVARIARLVEGLPLALELAAAWVKVLKCSDIADELERNLDLLTTSLKNVPERHRSVQAVFEHSWQLLSEEERRLYARLSVFGSSFSLPAAKQIAGATLAQLSELHSKSLLHFADGRYSAHHLLKQCAAEKLQAQDKEAVRRQHAAYYSQQLFEQSAFLKGGQQKAVLQQVALELDNIRLVWNWAFETGDIATLDRSLEGLWLLVELRGWFQEGAEAFGRLLSFLALRSDDVPLLRAKTYARLGRCHFRLGQLTEAQALLKQSLELLSEADVSERAFVLNNLGLVARDKGEAEKANDYFAESLELYRQVADSWGIANVLNNSGDIAFRLGHLAKAQQFYQESLELYRERQDLRGMGLALVNLGGVYEQQGNVREAKRLFSSSLEMARELADPYVESRALTRLAHLALSTKQLEEAKDFYGQSLELALTMGNRAEAALMARQLGQLATDLRAFAEAEAYFNQSLALFRKLANPLEIARGLEALVNLHTLTNNQERVLELLSEEKWALAHC
jgi:predicted ATPase/DNA-binding SARP family transcriptional activator